MKTTGVEASRAFAFPGGGNADRHPPQRDRNLFQVPCATCSHIGGVHHARVGHVDVDAGRCTVAGCRCTMFKAPAAPGPVAPLPGEVALAFNSNHCAMCRRAINVLEPIYRANTPGGVLCAACQDVACVPGAPLAHPPAPGDMVTSVLLRRAAQLIDEHGASGYAEGHIIARELRQRAELLQALSDGDCGNEETRGDFLIAIGEVRS